MNEINQSITSWLQTACNIQPIEFQSLAGDASFRHYYRCKTSDQSYIVMDASRELPSCEKFFRLSQKFKNIGIQTPEIFFHDIAKGFLVLTDFGDEVLLKVLNPQNVTSFYGQAMDVLMTMQACHETAVWQLPVFDADIMLQELQLFQEWFLREYLQLSLSATEEQLLEQQFQCIVAECAAQPRVIMHRDFHSANLMVLSNQSIGVLDFQDAFLGPFTYDLVSLLRDCYVSWPEETVYRLVEQFHQKISASIALQQFIRAFDWMGMQRHMKALLTFSRKKVRDHNSNYLQHIPRTLNYVITVSERYPELRGLHQYLSQHVRQLC